MSHYDTLGVNKDATQDEIKKAYRKLASQHHPDKGGDTAQFQKIEEAYRILSDASKRNQYDMEGQGFRHHQFEDFGGGHGHPDMNEIFKNFGFHFGGGNPFDPFRQHHQQPRRNKDLRVNIAVSLASTLDEQKKTISVQTTNNDRTTVEVTIPRGVTHGTNIKYPNLGDNLFNTLPRGDLYVHIAVQGDENFISHGVDLYTSVSVNCLLAIVGGDVTVNGIDGKHFVINAPAGLQAGTKFRIAQQGLFIMNSSVKGDLYAEVKLIVPQNLTSEQQETVRNLLTSQ
jgi:DnaJ-class molecular chaperone